LTLRVNQSLAKTAASVNYPSARLPRLIQIDAPFSSRLSRDKRIVLLIVCIMLVLQFMTWRAIDRLYIPTSGL
jgi:hypothetical protein